MNESNVVPFPSDGCPVHDDKEARVPLGTNAAELRAALLQAAQAMGDATSAPFWERSLVLDLCDCIDQLNGEVRRAASMTRSGDLIQIKTLPSLVTQAARCEQETL